MVSHKAQILDHFFFFIYINDLNHGVKFFKIHHFSVDTNHVHFTKSVNKLNKYINIDIKNLTNWLNAKKNSLNVKKLN